MKVVLSREATERLEGQIAYLRETDRIEIATVWHTSQDRGSTAKP
jgi:hypothetical protein